MRDNIRGIVAGHGLLTVGWFCTSVLVVQPIAAASGQSVATVAAASTLLFVVVSTAMLATALRRWRARAVEEMRVRRSPTELDRLRSMFLAAVSHELRTPVTNLVGYAETLRVHRDELSPGQVDRLTDRLVANGERLERLVLDLLDLHPGGSGGKPLQRSAVDVDGLLPVLVEEHGDRDRTIVVDADVGLVLCEERGLRRIVAELLDNVQRHTPVGTSATVSATRHGASLVLVVEDDGPGLDESVAGDVADPFVQGLETALDPGPGLGIGLALVAHHAERHGGQLSLSVAPSGGTRATVLLPAGAIVVPPMAADDGADHGRGANGRVSV